MNELEVAPRQKNIMEVEQADVELAQVKPVGKTEEMQAENKLSKGKIVDPSMKDLAVFHVGLPESIYTCAIIMPLCENLSEGYWANLFIIAQVYISHIVNVLIQAVLIAYVYVIYKANEVDLGFCGGLDEFGERRTESVVRYLCVLVYIGYCIRDLAQTVKMFCFIYVFPTSQKFEYLRFTEEDEIVSFGSGMTRCRKTSVFLFVLIPKFALAASLLVYGTGFVVVCESDQDLILNALALGFIFDIDEIFYEYLLTSQQQQVVESLPRASLKMNSFLHYSKAFGMIMKAIILFGISRFAYGKFCIADS